MKLANAANKFNTTVAADAYTPAVTFMCQYDPLSFSKVDGVQIRKRQISVAPDVVLPTRGVVRVGGENYLIGHGAPDYWDNKVLRNTIIVQGADGLANLHSIAGVLATATPVSAYAAVVFNKYLPDSADSSKYPPQYQVFLAESESAPSDSLIELNSEWYMVKESYKSTSGLRIALANVLDLPLFETINYSVQTYAPVTDTYTGVTTSVKIMRVKWQEHFNYLSIGSTTYERGDMQVFVLKTAMPAVKPSDTLTLSDGTWKVISRQSEGTVWSIHVRRA